MTVCEFFASSPLMEQVLVGFVDEPVGMSDVDFTTSKIGGKPVRSFVVSIVL